MNEIVKRLICVLIGYGLGCIQNAYIICKKVKGVDIRNYGSGNAGTTNVMRLLGKKWGITVLALDIAKGVLGPLLAAILFGYSNRHLLLWAGIGVITGHSYPCWMKFRGGKGVATTIGVYCISMPIPFCIAAVPSLTFMGLTKYVSVGSLTFAVLLSVLSIVFYHSYPHGAEMILLTFAMAVHCFYVHRGNISRLIHGKESKMGDHVSVDQPNTPRHTNSSK